MTKGPGSHSPRNLILLLQGQFVSSLGNQLYDVALLLWIKELTGSAALMGLAMLVTNLPEALLAPLGGSVADRFGRVKTMVFADLCGGLALGIMLLAALTTSNTTVLLGAMIATNLVLGLSAACFSPAASAVMPSLVKESRLARANAAQQFAGVGARVLGQAAGGLIYALLGAVWAVGLNAASFLASAFSESFIRPPKQGDAPPVERAAEKSLLGSTRETLGRVWENQVLRRLVLQIALFHLCLSALPVTLPFLAQHRLGLADTWLGFLIASYTVGIMAGFVVAGALPSENADRKKRIAGAACLTGVSFVGAGLFTSVGPVIAALFGVGVGIGVVIVNLMTELQLSSRDEERGRTMGVAQAVGGSSLPLGMALFGLILDACGRAGLPYRAATAGLLALCGLTAVALGAYMLWTGRRSIQGRAASN